MVALVGANLDTGDFGRRQLQLHPVLGVAVSAEVADDLPRLELRNSGA